MVLLARRRCRRARRLATLASYRTRLADAAGCVQPAGHACLSMRDPVRESCPWKRPLIHLSLDGRAPPIRCKRIAHDLVYHHKYGDRFDLATSMREPEGCCAGSQCGRAGVCQGCGKGLGSHIVACGVRLTGMPRIVIYTTPFCSYCISAKALLRRKRVEFTEINVAGAPDRRAEMAERANGLTTVPQIFIGSDYVGGCDELHALEGAGKLDSLLAR
jgi:glutaredoxin 3